MTTNDKAGQTGANKQTALSENPEEFNPANEGGGICQNSGK